ncbi:MAG: L-serine ammonia-lyase [Arcanobacterium sp.]|nr:L-serine ammonia-lyase [Arcanobacterium sp.]
MALSVFDLFSIGIGPSSSHTVGPMRAAKQFIDEIPAAELLKIQTINCTLYGSLGATGLGHGTDFAVILGLLGEVPETVDPRAAGPLVKEVHQKGFLKLPNGQEVSFKSQDCITFSGEIELPAHPNGMKLVALGENDVVIHEGYFYSIGGGFVVRGDAEECSTLDDDDSEIPYPYHTAEDLLKICKDTGFSIARVALENELTWRTEAEVRSGLIAIWNVMNECIENGIKTEGVLPGALRVTRRAPALYRKLSIEAPQSDPLSGMDWITLYALSVNEENAAGGRVVTAPTNGAAGIIPAVLRYYNDFVRTDDHDAIVRFLLTAGAIGIIFKNTASISGAEVGCQGEVGSACSMAAGGMAAILGGSPQQVENAAEIGMEHNLGLTCDPIGGLVQIPCIERNAIASVKAIAAARTALRGDGSHIVSLDSVIKTMRETGLDMQSKYKETSLGGLAVNVTIC